MRELKLWWDDRNAMYRGQLKDEYGISATVAKTHKDLQVWCADNKITRDEFFMSWIDDKN